jgi:hypothetical protein
MAAITDCFTEGKQSDKGKRRKTKETEHKTLCCFLANGITAAAATAI